MSYAQSNAVDQSRFRFGINTDCFRRDIRDLQEITLPPDPNQTMEWGVTDRGSARSAIIRQGQVAIATPLVCLAVLVIGVTEAPVAGRAS